jgi:hypothetical protein
VRLLDLVALPTAMEHAISAEAEYSRRSPRLHHVRGHIARRGDKVFWKSPCLRGNAMHGVIRSRTVELRFCQSRHALTKGSDVGADQPFNR